MDRRCRAPVRVLHLNKLSMVFLEIALEIFALCLCSGDEVMVCDCHVSLPSLDSSIYFNHVIGYIDDLCNNLFSPFSVFGIIFQHFHVVMLKCCSMTACGDYMFNISLLKISICDFAISSAVSASPWASIGIPQQCWSFGTVISTLFLFRTSTVSMPALS